MYLQNQNHIISRNNNNKEYKQPYIFTFPQNKTTIDQFKFDMNSINMVIIRNKFKLNDCSLYGFSQLILDINFLAAFYHSKINNPQEDSKLFIDTDELLAKFVEIYSSENLKKCDEIPFKRDIWNNLCQEFIKKDFIRDSVIYPKLSSNLSSKKIDKS